MKKQFNNLFNLIILILVLLGFVFTQNIMAQRLYGMGPSGGGGGAAYNDQGAIPPKPVVKYIEICHGDLIDGFGVEYEQGKGPWHGGRGGRCEIWPEDGFRLNEQANDFEYITKITGTYGYNNVVGYSTVLIVGLQFHTNKKRSSKSFGGTGGIPFIYDAPTGYQIVGFHGRAGHYIDAFGVILARVPKP